MSGYCDDQFFYNWKEKKIHMGDPDLKCRPETPQGTFWQGPFDTLEEAKTTANKGWYLCRGCFNPVSNQTSVNAISTPMGGQPGYKLKRKQRG